MNFNLWREYMKKFHGLALFTAVLLAMTQTAIAQFNTHISHRLISGKSVQTVKAGDFIEPVVYEITELNRVYDFYINYPVNTTVKTLGLKLDCGTLPSSKAECTISGRIPANTPGHEYEMSFTAAGNYAHEYLQITTGINVIPLNEQVEHVSGSLDQTVTAGDPIEPIIFGYTKLLKVNLSGAPEGLSVKLDDETSTISITGAPDQDFPDKILNYQFAAYITEKDSIVFKGTITVNHKKFVTTLVPIENETQDVIAGDEIKPIVFRYAHMQKSYKISGIPKSLEVHQDKEKDLIIISGKIPENSSDQVCTITVTAMGYDNDAEATATINVKHKPGVTRLEHVSGSTSQTVEAGSAIEPITFKYENALHIGKLTGQPNGKFSLTPDNEKHTLTLSGTINELSEGEYKIAIVVEGEINNDTAYVTLKVSPKTATITLISGKESQTVEIGESIEPLVFKYAYVKNVKVSGYIPEGVEVSSDKESHTVTLSGKVTDNVAGEYEFSVNVEGVANTASAKAKIIVKAKESSSSATSSSSIASSSSNATVASSSSVVPSSDSREKSSSSVTASSSSAKSSSSTESATSSSSSSKNDKKSSSSKAKSSSSEKGSAIELVKYSTINFCYANNELTVTLASASTAHVQIFDMMGHLLDTYELHSSASINLGHLPRGAMLARISNKSFAKTSRIVIK